MGFMAPTSLPVDSHIYARTLTWPKGRGQEQVPSTQCTFGAYPKNLEPTCLEIWCVFDGWKEYTYSDLSGDR